MRSGDEPKFGFPQVRWAQGNCSVLPRYLGSYEKKKPPGIAPRRLWFQIILSLLEISVITVATGEEERDQVGGLVFLQRVDQALGHHGDF